MQYEEPGLSVDLQHLATQECAEVAHAVEVAAHVGDTSEPRLCERHCEHWRHRNHLRRVLEADQPRLPADLDTQARRQARTGFGALQALRQRELVFAQRYPAGGSYDAHPRAVIFLSSSAWLIGLTM